MRIPYTQTAIIYDLTVCSKNKSFRAFYNLHGCVYIFHSLFRIQKMTSPALKNDNFWKCTLWGTISDFFHFIEKSYSILRYSIFHTQLKTAYQLPKLWYHDVYLHSKSFQIDAQLVFTTTLSSIHTLFTFLYEHIHKLSPFLVLLIHIQHFFPIFVCLLL